MILVRAGRIGLPVDSVLSIFSLSILKKLLEFWLPLVRAMQLLPCSPELRYIFLSFEGRNICCLGLI